MKIPVIPTPYKVVAAVAVVSVFGWRAYAFGVEHERGKQAREQLRDERVALIAANTAGDVFLAQLGDKIRPRFTTINNEIQHETRVEPRYLSGDCSHTDTVWLQISSAYEALGYPPLDRGGLSEAAAPGG